MKYYAAVKYELETVINIALTVFFDDESFCEGTTEKVKKLIEKEELKRRVLCGELTVIGAYDSPIIACFPVDTMVGFTAMSNSGEIEAICVVKRMRKKGIASALIDNLKTLCKEREIPEIFALSNDDSMRLFERAGFVFEAESNWLKYRNTDD